MTKNDVDKSIEHPSEKDFKTHLNHASSLQRIRVLLGDTQQRLCILEIHLKDAEGEGRLDLSAPRSELADCFRYFLHYLEGPPDHP